MRFIYALLFLGLVSGGAHAQAPGDTGTIRIPIHEMMDFNFKTRQEIYDLRTRLVTAYPQFLQGDYKPLDSVFQQITDGKPWWGMLGRSYYGPGQKSIEGLSEESRFLANPFLLVGLDSGHASVVKDLRIMPQPIYPIPLELSWSNDGKTATAKYDVTTFWEGERRIHDSPALMHQLTLVSYNARDLGWNFLYVSPGESKNVTAASTPTQIMQFIHTGGSCGYPGGCNNMSPHQEGLEIKVEQLPAIAYIKLWKNEPSDASSPPDMVFIIQMI